MDNLVPEYLKARAHFRAEKAKNDKELAAAIAENEAKIWAIRHKPGYGESPHHVG
jgi:phage gp16-like protein